MFLFQMIKLQAWHWNNLHCSTAEARRCFWMKSCQIVFSRPSLLVQSATRLRRCPRGAGKQSGFGTSHSLSSQGLWSSADYTTNCSLYPRPCLANYEYSLAMNVILSDMQLSIQIMSPVLVFFCLKNLIILSRFLSDFDICAGRGQRESVNISLVFLIKWPNPLFLSHVLNCCPTKNTSWATLLHKLDVFFFFFA